MILIKFLNNESFHVFVCEIEVVIFSIPCGILINLILHI